MTKKHVDCVIASTHIDIPPQHIDTNVPQSDGGYEPIDTVVTPHIDIRTPGRHVDEKKVFGINYIILRIKNCINLDEFRFY
jgi:hypothetical protein